jgi:hypothetical protein
MTVEQTAIRIATEYATANRYDVDRTAIGLVLAGMAIAAAAGPDAQAVIVAGYLADFPLAEPSIRGWAALLDEASVAGGGPGR